MLIQLQSPFSLPLYRPVEAFFFHPSFAVFSMTIQIHISEKPDGSEGDTGIATTIAAAAVASLVREPSSFAVCVETRSAKVSIEMCLSSSPRKAIFNATNFYCSFTFYTNEYLQSQYILHNKCKNDQKYAYNTFFSRCHEKGNLSIK